MRFIAKQGDGGYQLNRSNAKPPATAGEAQSRWSGFNFKKEVSGYLIREQYGLCAYSEIRPDRAAIGTHIEHVEPKSQNPSRTFDYSNLVLSALSHDDLKRNSVDVFAGHAKGSRYNAVEFISCLQSDCSKFFVYLSNGNVEPARGLSKVDMERVLYTIDLLSLNCPYLIAQRKNWLDELDELIDAHINNDQSLECLAAVDLIPLNNLLSQFFTATRQRFSHIGEKVLADYYPALI